MTNPSAPPPQRWLEVEIEADEELADTISEAIYDHVEGGVAIEQLNDRTGTADRWEDEKATGPIKVRGYLPFDETQEARKLAIEKAIFYLNMVRRISPPTYKIVEQSDWASAWKVAFKPLRIGERIVIRPSWVTEADFPTRANDVTLLLDPGLAFGTGLHPTTQLCALAVEEQMKPGWRVLDVGSGSGVLSILAARFGAKEVLGVDTDPEADRAGRENATLNGVADVVKIRQGSLADATAEAPFDLVVANILAGVIISMLKTSPSLASYGPRFLFSGILDTQADDVVAAMQAAGLRLVERKQMSDWVCLVGERT
ncbi:MAG TPA: 50S ribosomal protein L11 methyltransferase [Thermoflexales bacterium]|jgi:ribosomal protein L11 methyltransferase|nr:50S ribosomal protein L11 methyltransferase [Thermoflexales bacterium]HRA52957.1 50S ribosomal protein L11 methyltransferase [Thermoflexales bacterium]